MPDHRYCEDCDDYLDWCCGERCDHQPGTEPEFSQDWLAGLEVPEPVSRGLRYWVGYRWYQLRCKVASGLLRVARRVDPDGVVPEEGRASDWYTL